MCQSAEDIYTANPARSVLFLCHVETFISRKSHNFLGPPDLQNLALRFVLSQQLGLVVLSHRDIYLPHCHPGARVCNRISAIKGSSSVLSV